MLGFSGVKVDDELDGVVELSGELEVPSVGLSVGLSPLDVPSVGLSVGLSLLGVPSVGLSVALSPFVVPSPGCLGCGFSGVPSPGCSGCGFSGVSSPGCSGCGFSGVPSPGCSGCGFSGVPSPGCSGCGFFGVSSPGCSGCGFFGVSSTFGFVPRFTTRVTASVVFVVGSFSVTTPVSGLISYVVVLTVSPLTPAVTSLSSPSGIELSSS